MIKRCMFVLVALLGTISAAAWGGESRKVQLAWNDLGPRIANKKVALVLPDGTHVEGKVIGVEPDALRLNISKSSDRTAQPKGKQRIPRQAVTLLRVIEHGKMGRLLGTLGGAAVAGGIAAASYPDIYGGTALIAVPAVVAAGVTGSAIAGYYTGKRFDKRVTEIRIAPEPSGTPAS